MPAETVIVFNNYNFNYELFIALLQIDLYSVIALQSDLVTVHMLAYILVTITQNLIVLLYHIAHYFVTYAHIT